MLKNIPVKPATLGVFLLMIIAGATSLLAQESATNAPAKPTINQQQAANLVAGNYEIYIQGQYYDLTFEGNDKGITLLSPVLGNRDLQVDDLDQLHFSFTDHDGVNKLEFIRTEKGEVNSFFLSWGEDDRHQGRRISEDRVFRDAFTRQEMLSDLDQLSDLMQMHPQLTEYTSEEEFSRLKEQARNQMREGMTAAEFYRAAAPLVAAIGCYHTRAYAPSHHWQSVGAGLLPLGLEIVGEQVYVRDDLSATGSIPPGSRVLAIEDRPVGELVKKLGQYVESDGFNPSNREAYLEGGFHRYYQLVFGAKPHFEIDYIPYASDKPERTKVNACSHAQIRQKMDTGAEALELVIHDDEDLAILRMDHFGFYQNKEEFNNFVDESFAAISGNSDPGIGNLIIDTRGNGGGDPYAARYLLSYLAQEPMVYFHNPPESLADTGQPMPLAERNHFSGKVYMMLDGGEGSTTGHLIALLKHHDLCEFVGTESGATYFCNDASARFTMKNSRMRLKMARASFEVEVTGMAKDRGIMPDHPVKPTPADLAEKRDTTLQYTRNLIAGRK